MEHEAAQETPEISFPAGLPGFPGAHRFHLDPLDDAGAVYALRNLDQPGLRFIVVPPAMFFPGYAPRVDEQTSEQACEQGDELARQDRLARRVGYVHDARRPVA